MESVDLPLLITPSGPTVHPDGTRAVVAATRPDFDADAYVGQLWEVPLPPDLATRVTSATVTATPVTSAADAMASVAKPRRLTRGFRDTRPRYSPDGTMLAFLRAGRGTPPQLHLVDARGGEPRPLTDRKLGVVDFNWSPDSTRIVFSSRDPEHGRYATVDGVPAAAEDPRLIESMAYRMNGLGYTRDQRQQLFTLCVPGLDDEPVVEPIGRAKETRSAGEEGAGQADTHLAVPTPTQLTDADADHRGPAYSPDGRHILFTAALHAERDTDLVTDVYLLPADAPAVGADPTAVATGHDDGPSRRWAASAGRISHDGQWMFFLATDMSDTGRDFVARNTFLCVAPVDDSAPVNGSARVRILTDAETTDLGPTDELVAYGDDAVLVRRCFRGGIELLRIHADGRSNVVLGGAREVTGVAAAGTRIVAVATDPSTTGELYAVSGEATVTGAGTETGEATGVAVPLTDFSAALRDRCDDVELIECTFTSPDGYPVHGWVLQPEADGPHPVLLNIHGGPFAHYGWGFFDEARVYARAGYAVLLCNPRGSAGYGQAHGRAIKEAMGTVDEADVLAFVDGALDRFPRLDPERLGIMGGSYGGYLTAWIISRDHRFRAAIVERGYLDPASFVGSSDIGWFFSTEYTGDDPEETRRQSPFARVDDVRTPTFVIHSEQDLRCPVEQAQRYFAALKNNDVHTQLLLFPGENHELSRSGTPHHRRQRFDRILAWWAHYLPTNLNTPMEEGRA